MHKPVRMFSESGVIHDDKYFIRIRDELERIMIEQMKDLGFLPIHDFGPFWSTTRINDHYSFRLTMYGSFAGKRKSQKYDFWHEGRLVKSG